MPRRGKFPVAQAGPMDAFAVGLPSTAIWQSPAAKAPPPRANRAPRPGRSVKRGSKRSGLRGSRGSRGRGGAVIAPAPGPAPRVRGTEEDFKAMPPRSLEKRWKPGPRPHDLQKQIKLTGSKDKQRKKD